MGRSLVKIPFHTTDIKINKICSASNVGLWEMLEGGTLADLEPLRYSLCQYDNGNYLVKLEDGRFIEFSE